jgi:D-glycero-beta-D-manno-heptose 1-phosphate adenylyltransferase
MGEVVDESHLRQVVEAARAAGKRIVLTNGCFDLIHIGHIRSLKAARSLGDLLVVGVNSDASVRQLKGPDRPLVPDAERAEVMAALEPVDFVTIFAEPTAERLVSLVRPDCYVKGADYSTAGDGADTTIDERRLPETSAVRAGGGRVVLLPLAPGRSTTELVRRIRAGVDPA